MFLIVAIVAVVADAVDVLAAVELVSENHKNTTTTNHQRRAS